MARYTARALASEESGSVAFSGGQTQTITIDGKSYTITNKSSSAQEIAYSIQNDDTIQFICSNFTIRGQSDVAHKIDIVGKNNTVYGGELDDVITSSLTGSIGLGNYIYGLDGNDTLISKGDSSVVYGGNGDDEITMLSYGYADGGDGDDTISVSYYSSEVHGGAGNDTIIYNSSYSYIGNGLFGDDGDDIFVIKSGKNVLLDGGSGTNTVTDNGTDTIKINVDGANAYSEIFAKNATKEILINGIKYTVTNNKSSDNMFIGQISDSTIKFSSSNFTIKGEKDKAHNVLLTGSNCFFYGGDLSDIIEAQGGYSNNIYGEGGDDIISGFGWIVAHGGDGNDIISGGGENLLRRFVYGDAGDDVINVGNLSANTVVYGGDGNDTFNIDGSLSDEIRSTIVYGQGGDDTFNVKNGKYVSLFGGSGTNTLNTDNGVNTQCADMSNVSNNMTAVSFDSDNKTRTISINGIAYTVRSLQSDMPEHSLGYYYNSVTDEITLVGYNFEIVGEAGKKHNVKLIGQNLTFYGGNLDDKINIISNHYGTVYGGAGDDYIEWNGYYSCAIHGGAGDDEIVLNSRNDSLVDGGDGNDIISVKNIAKNVQGGAGDDHYIISSSSGVTVTDTIGDNIFELSGSKINATGGTGKDTFYVTGSNNTVFGAGGDDYILIDGNNNTVDGGSGNNTIVDNGTGNTKTNVAPDPNSGVLYFNSQGQIQSVTIGGIEYTITNTTTEATPQVSNQIRYSYNSITGEVEFAGDNFTIQGDDSKAHNIVVKGSNNVVGGGSKNDKIKVDSGQNNLIKGNAGDDTIIINTENNKVLGGAGDDIIKINASTGSGLVDGEAGKDIIEVNADNCTNIKGGAGNDKITLNGIGNNADGGDGNDTLTAIGSDNTISSASGNNTFGASGDNNTIVGGAGKDKFDVDGDFNRVTTTAGDNEVKIEGSSNTVTGSDGSETMNIYGESTTVNSGGGDDTINIYGSNNTVSSDSGENEFTIYGDDNNVLGGADNDSFYVMGSKNTINGEDGDDFFVVVEDAKDNNIDGNNGENTLRNYGENTTFTNVRDITDVDKVTRFQIGADGSGSSAVSFKTGFDLGLINIDLSDPDKAAKALDKIDKLMTIINTKSAEYGTLSNRFDSVLDNIAMKIENLTASKSTIMDADIAQECADYTRASILAQTATALAAQIGKNDLSIITRLVNGE